MDFETIGKKVDKIPVHLHHRLIELFSAGLYSSPNKAFEELVCNSYDAHADKVSVYLPSDTRVPNSIILVCDNGESMDTEGLKILWKIGYSNRRKPESEKSDRKPIGKFGIGKLATYVLAHKLTYICKSKEEFRAVTMDYGKVDTNEEKATEMILDERCLSEEEVIKVLKPIIETAGKKLLNFDLWGNNAEDSWTIAIMSDLKEKAHKIQDGRLKWVLSTALPLSPGFNLLFNGTEIESSKINIPLIKKWVLGKDDEVAEKNNYETSIVNKVHVVNLPHIKNIHGKIELYENSLVRGKSQDVGRSHGIFLMIRGRLINIDNPLIGSMAELHHATFNRCRIIVNADELDEYLTSGRESVKDCEAFSDFQKYINQKFNKVKAFFDDYIGRKEEERNASRKVAYTSSSLSRRPIITVVKKFFKGDIDSPLLINLPENLSKEEQNKLISELEEESISDKGIIKNIYMDVLAPEDPIAKFDLSSREVKINILHPFFTNFLHDFKSNLPFQLIATTEILTEALLLETGVEQDIVKMIMGNRDQLFRELTYNDNPNAPYVASMIKSALADPSGLEDAVFFGFKSLGFYTTKIGGRGEPDGKASATLGVDAKKERGDYSLIYDAKSTKKDKIKAETIKTAACVRHRTKYKADYSVVIAIDFEGSENSGSACNIEAKQQKVALIKASDFWKLVLLAIPNQLNYSDYKEFLEKCHTVPETHKWICEIEKRKFEKKPIRELLDTTFKLMKSDIEPPNINAIRVKNDKLIKYSKDELISLVKSLNNLVPRLISIDKKENVHLETHPERIMECINRVVEADVPAEYTEIFMKVFEVKSKS